MQGETMFMLKQPLVSGCTLALILGFAAPVYAVTINVTSSAQLVSAFATAEAHPSNFYDVVLKKMTYKPASTLSLTVGHVNLTGSGSSPSSYVIDGGGTLRVFLLQGTGSLTVTGVTVQNGFAAAPYAGGGFFILGGGYVQITRSIIRNNRASQPGSGIAVSASTLYLNGVTLDNNVNSQFPNNCGGGLTSGGGGLGVYSDSFVQIQGSTFTNNKACRGGGILISCDNCQVNLENSTLSANEAKYRGGAIFFQGGSSSYHTFRFNTIMYNTAGTTPDTIEKKYGGGIGFWGYNGFLSAAGNIVAKNSVTYDMSSTLFYKASDCYWEGGLYEHQIGSNIIGDLSNCSQFGSSGWFGIGWEGAPFDPVMGQLAANGAKTGYQLQTIKPLSNSPVIGSYQAVSTPCEDDWDCPPGVDGRGYRRSKAASGTSDYGAIEFNGKP